MEQEFPAVVDSATPAPVEHSPAGLSSPAAATPAGEEVYFLKRKELHFGGHNHAHTALLLADVDGDGEQELVVGGLDGTLALFKGLDQVEPWAVGTGLGMLRVFAAGRVWPWLVPAPTKAASAPRTSSTEEDARENTEDDSERELPPQLVAVTVEGDVHIFDLAGLGGTQEEETPPAPPQHERSKEEDKKKAKPWPLVPRQTVAIEPNVTAALIVDVDGDGVPELLLGRMDGTIQVFGWRPPRRPVEDDDKEHEREDGSQRPNPEPAPELYEKASAQVSSAVVSLSAVGGDGGGGSTPLCIVAGLDTGTVEVLRCFSRSSSLDGAEADNHESPPPLSSLVELGINGGLPLPHCGWSGPLTCCALPPQQRGAFAIAGLDGRLAMGMVVPLPPPPPPHDEQHEDLLWKTVWSLQTTAPFFAVAPFHISPHHGYTSQGFAACGWSGMTCLVNAVSTKDGTADDVHLFDASSMLVPPLRGFVGGAFGPAQEPCLFYSGADGHILVFHDMAAQASSVASQEDARLLLRSHETKALVQSWVDLHLSGGGGRPGGGDEEGGEEKEKGKEKEERSGGKGGKEKRKSGSNNAPAATATTTAQPSASVM